MGWRCLSNELGKPPRYIEVVKPEKGSRFRVDIIVLPDEVFATIRFGELYDEFRFRRNFDEFLFSILLECMQEALQAAFERTIAAPQQNLVADAAKLPQDDLEIPTQEAVSSSAIQPVVPTKQVSLGLPDASKTAVISAVLPHK